MLIPCASISHCYHFPHPFNAWLSCKPTSELFTAFGNGWSANSRRPHERQRTAAFAMAETALARFKWNGNPSTSRYRTVTDSRDANLKANVPAAVGGSKEERKRERLSEPTRSILEAPAAAIQWKRVPSRCPGDELDGSPSQSPFSRTNDC